MEARTLYGLNKAGGFKVWIISTDEQGLITIQHGKEDGKLQTKSESVKGKNIGRSNETTPAEQAESEALSRIKNQIDKGYRESKLDLADIPLIAMLAVDYHKQGHRIVFPCYSSVKFDGVRLLAKKRDGTVTLESRTGQLYELPLIQAELNAAMHDGDVLDGEVYLHGYALQTIVSAVKRTDTQKEVDKAIKAHKKAINTAQEGEKEQAYVEAVEIQRVRPLLEFHVFDKPELDVPFVTRLEWLGEYMNRFAGSKLIKRVHYDLVLNEKDMLLRHKAAVAAGYEGLMLRNFTGEYESGKRSADLQKYKHFLDSEFLILDIIADKDGLAVFVVQNTFAPNTFQVIMGSKAEKAEYLANKRKYVGKLLTVKYQTLYKDTLKPQFPVGVVIRDYD
jgi:DNA ligase-1